MSRYILLIFAAIPFCAATGQTTGNYCQTQFGVCTLQRPAPLYSSCSCAPTAQRRDSGRVISKLSSSGKLSGLCRTPVGICQATAAPVDTPCMCGRDRGRMVPNR